MQERHLHSDQYFEEQVYTSKNHIIPFIEGIHELQAGAEVLEIGCGEGGNLKPFLDRGCRTTGIDLNEDKIAKAKKIYAGHPDNELMTLIAEDIYNVGGSFDGKFDVIMMRDVLEHIHDHDRFLKYAKRFLKPGGLFFLGFPPWQNPFGGHQQMCHSRFLSHLPYFHLLPGQLYPGFMKLFGEPDDGIGYLLEIRDTRISIEKFRRIIRREGYRIRKEVFWFVNPNYEIKFRLKPRKQAAIINGVPWIRNFLITTCYYIIDHPVR